MVPYSLSAGANLHEPPSLPPELQQLALNFLATFFLFSVVTLNNNRHTSASAQKIFTLPNMRPLSIHEAHPPRPWVTGDTSAGSVLPHESITTVLLLALSPISL